MKCNKCGSKWETNASRSTSIIVCPFCQEKIVAEKLSDWQFFDNTKELLTYIATEYGNDALFGRKYFSDHSLPSMPQGQKNLVKQAFECGAIKILQDNMNSDQARKETAVKQAVGKLVDTYASAKEAAERVVWEFTNAIGWAIPEQQEPIILVEDAKNQHKKLKEMRERFAKYQCCISAGSITAGLKTDGTVIAAGDSKRKYNTYILDIEKWFDIVAVSVVNDGIIGLKSNGNVIAAGTFWSYRKFETYIWHDIVAIYSRGSCVAGLQTNGRVVKNCSSFPDNDYKWFNIIAISVSKSHMAGLKSDGTVIADGNNDDGQCDTGEWSDIVAINTSYRQTVGVKSDGTIVGAGYKSYEFLAYKWNDIGSHSNKWTGIVSLSGPSHYTVGLKSNGTVVATQHYHTYNERSEVRNIISEISEWRDIIAVFSEDNFVIGLKSNGTVVAAGQLYYGDINDESWGDLREITKWQNIIAISIGHRHIVGLKSDGTVISLGRSKDDRCNTGQWHNIGLPNRGLMKKRTQEMEEELHRELLRADQSARWKKQGLCQHCGSKMKGVLNRKCTICGRLL